MPQTTIPYEVWRIGRRIRQLFDAALLGIGISSSDFALYSLLRAGPMTPSEVSRRSGLPATTVSKALQRVEDRGHLSRERHPVDGRSTQVSLNASGARLHARGWKRVEAVIEAIDRELGEDAQPVYFATIRLDNALRTLTGVDTSEGERGFRPAETWLTASLRYDGEPLRSDEEDLVREYIEWIRWRRVDRVSG